MIHILYYNAYILATYETNTERIEHSKNLPTYLWNIPQTLNQQDFGDAWGMLQGYVGILLHP